jgi:ABC-type phosphate transport system substrate-binding protein
VPKLNKVLMAGGIAAAVLGILAGQAVADPPSGVTPHKKDVVGTGSDTTQLAIDKISSDYNTANSKLKQWYSFDVTGSATIKEKAGCTARTRPVGSGAGITELEANLHPSGDTADFCVDYARSSRARAVTDPSSIVFVPFAYDAVTWAADKLTGSTNAPTNLTTTQLQAIYSCDASLLGTGKSGPVKWNEVGGVGHHAVIPVIPQSSSGTRSFFLSKIGVTTLGSCVQGQTSNDVVENEGTNAILKDTSTSKNIVFPYSVAVYLGQSQNGHGTGDQGKMKLRDVNGVSGTTGPSGKKVIKLTFPYLREVYNVVRNADSSGDTLKIPTYLQPYFGNGTANSGFMCSSTAKKDATNFGFRAMDASHCGIPE